MTRISGTQLLGVLHLLALLVTVMAQTGESEENKTVAGPNQAWLGVAPSCQGDWYKCKPFNMKTISMDSYGDGGVCVTGQKALCELTPAPKSSESASSDGLLQMIPYNIYQHPYIMRHDGQIERTCRIPELLAQSYPDVDVIIIVEAFLGGCTPEMNFTRLFKYYGWPHVSRIIGEDYQINGGVMIASKHELVEIEAKIFTSSALATADNFAARGFLFTRFEKGGKMVNLLMSQLQSGEGQAMDDIRKSQAGEIYNYMQSKGLRAKDISVFAGDLNVNNLTSAEKATELLTLMGYNPIERTGSLKANFDHEKNDLVDKGAHKGWYIYFGIGLKEAKASRKELEAIDLKTEHSFSFCNNAPMSPYWIFEKSVMCMGTMSTRDVSNQFPVLAKLQFK